MKKVFFLVMVMAMAVSCNSDEEQTKAREGEREARVIKDVHLRPVQGSYGNRVITLRCEDSLYLEYRGQELSALHHCSSKYELVGGSTEEIAALNGCYEVDSLTGALLGTSLFARFLGDQVEDALLVLPGNTIASDFSLQITPCHATLRMVCFNTDQRKLVAKGIYQENPTDTAYAIGEWLGIIEHLDTVRVVDTLRLGGDTVVVREVDTVFQNGDTIVDSTFTLITHDGEETIGVMTGNILIFTCHNSVTEVTFRNGSPYSQTPNNFDGKFPYNYTESGTYRSSHVGQAHRVINGTVNWGGFTQNFTHQTHYTIPAGYEPWLRYLGCDFVLDSAYGQSNGILVAGHFECGDHHTRATYFMPKNPTGDNPPTITRIDTIWCQCTTANAWYSPSPAEQVKATVGKTYSLERVWSDSTRTTVAGGTATTTYTWNIIRTGQPTNAMISIIPANGNPVSFGGGAFTEELTQVGSQRFCPLLWNSATLTSNGTVWSGSYAGTTVTVTVPETFLPPTPPIFSSVLAAAATDSYTHQIYSQASYRHTFVCVVAQIGSDYRFYWAELAANMVRADFDSVSITAAEANFYVNHLSDGYYPAMVYDHNNHTTLYRGVVTSVELTTGWQQTYRLAPSNSLAYVMGGSSWTMAGDTGRNAVRGVMNASGQIVADGITVQLY